MSSTLPFDVLQDIVESLSQPRTIDRETLFKLSLTCRSLLPLCRKHIFSTISLQPRSFDKNDPAKRPWPPNQNILYISITNMELLTTSSPSVVDWVRTFHLGLNAANVHDAGLVHLLDKFSFLESLFLTILFNQLYWANLPFPLQTALARIIKLQSVTSLSLSNLGTIPLSSILPLSNVTHLNVASCGFSLPDPNHEWGSNTAPSQLTNFCIQRGFSSVLPLLEARYPNGFPVVDHSGLTLFSLQLQSDCEEYSAATFLAKLTSLQSLDMSSPGAGKPLPLRSTPFNGPLTYARTGGGYVSMANIMNRVHPQSAERLKVLWFQTNLGNIYPLSDVDSLPTTVLQSMPVMKSILNLGITMNIISPAKVEVLIQDFSKLDALLASPQYATLTVVYIFLYFIGPTSLSRAELDAIPSIHMKRLSRNPSIKLIYEAHAD